MNKQSKETQSPNDVSKQLHFDDDEDTGRLVKLKRSELKKKAKKKTDEYNGDGSEATKTKKKGLEEIGQDAGQRRVREHRVQHDAELQANRVERGDTGCCRSDEVDGSTDLRDINVSNRDGRHVSVDAAGSA